MRIRPGDKFSYARILDSESQLRRSSAFRSVNIQTIGLTEHEPVVHLVVKLEEYRKIVADIGITYDTDNFFTGELSLSHVNLGGTIRRANLRIIGGRDIQRGELLFKDPFFVGYPFEATLNVFVERTLKPGFHTKEGGGSLGFLREFTPRATFLGRYELVRTFFTDVIDPTGIPEEDHTTSKFSFSYNYDHRDSFADPSRGYLLFSGIDISNKLLASTFNFIQPKGLAAYYYPLSGRTTFLAFAHMEGIKVFGSDTLARDDKLFLGGDYSVRGFEQDSIGPIGTDGRPAGGQLLLAATFELQTRLFSNFKFAVFQDNGSITDNFSQMGFDSFRHSAGAGIRYVTPVGPLRLDYGFKLDRKPGESIGRLHFAFGYSF
jgi:outer membrane protein insertion porin family